MSRHGFLSLMHTAKKPPASPGFTLLEVMVVVTILGVWTTIALPLFEKLQQRTLNMFMQK